MTEVVKIKKVMIDVLVDTASQKTFFILHVDPSSDCEVLS